MTYHGTEKYVEKKNQPLEIGPQKNSYSAFQHQKTESCKIFALFSSQACKNIFWEVGKPPSAGEAVHKTRLKSISRIMF